MDQSKQKGLTRNTRYAQSEINPNMVDGVKATVNGADDYDNDTFASSDHTSVLSQEQHSESVDHEEQNEAETSKHLIVKNKLPREKSKQSILKKNGSPMSRDFCFQTEQSKEKGYQKRRENISERSRLQTQSYNIENNLPENELRSVVTKHLEEANVQHLMSRCIQELADDFGGNIAALTPDLIKDKLREKGIVEQVLSKLKLQPDTDKMKSCTQPDEIAASDFTHPLRGDRRLRLQFLGGSVSSYFLFLFLLYI